jgi:hypothetical protein
MFGLAIPASPIERLWSFPRVRLTLYSCMFRFFGDEITSALSCSIDAVLSQQPVNGCPMWAQRVQLRCPVLQTQLLTINCDVIVVFCQILHPVGQKAQQFANCCLRAPPSWQTGSCAEVCKRCLHLAIPCLTASMCFIVRCVLHVLWT